ncbi:MAG TPA: PIG-L deacetylase family protein [Pyrinomonadaceae bacterium]|jgi:N-acetylglucosamine malate deacetylase 1|nr:PIG-L deacetylase family protein [Pyrinomonadaceae bacterium]
MRILVIAPHPDDETLGCGGSLLKHKSNGDSLSWLVATRGHEPHWSADLLDRKEKEIASVTAAYGFDQTIRLNFPTIRLDTIPLEEFIAAIRNAISDCKPELVYLNHFGDVHSDHRIVFEATLSVLKPFYSGTHGVKRILSYEVVSSTDAAPLNPARAFVPNVFTDVTDFLEKKLEIMALYESELQPSPLPRALDNLRALARLRGATIGVEFAEAFMLVREVN